MKTKAKRSFRDNKSVYDDQLDSYNDYFVNGIGTIQEKLSNFSKYLSRQDMTEFIVMYELFKKILNIHGSIVECGVRFGGGLITFAKLSAILEHVNYTRKIIGFDTFKGFPSLSKYDKNSDPKFAHKGALASSFNDLIECIRHYDMDRFVNHIPKIELVKGDAVKTIPKFLCENPHTVVSLLYLDFDLYKPTKVALENFVPRMPKGGIIVFDELNHGSWSGETLAVFHSIGIRNIKIERFSFDSRISYVVLD